MTLRTLLRLEDPTEGPGDTWSWGDWEYIPPTRKSFRSTFHRWYHGGAYLPGPNSDKVLAPEWKVMTRSLRSAYSFAFAKVEQVEAVWGPQEDWPEGMEEDLRSIAVLPGAVVDGETQVVYLDAMRVL